jgi:hypothetical protein
MTTSEKIELARHVAWPLVALVALFVLLPYLSRLLRAASDLRDLLDRSGEMVGLVGQVAALNDGLSELKAMEQLSRSERAPAARVTATAHQDLEALWKQLEKQWQDTREEFRAVARSAGVPVSFAGVVGVREAAKALQERGTIDETTASAMTDLSAQFQLVYRSPTARSEYLNDRTVATYAATAARVRAALKSAR